MKWLVALLFMAQMPDLLDKIYREQDWKTDPNKAAERAGYYRSLLIRSDLTPALEIRARLDLGENLTVAGDFEATVNELEKLRHILGERGIVVSAPFTKRLREALGIAYLRLGEQRNCVGNHNAQSCIYPLRGGGLHQDKRGAEGAVREYTALLEADSANLAARWLLHLAHMQAGTQAPARYRIREILPNDFDLGRRFIDVAHSTGTSLPTHAGGSVAEDFDNDGLFDLVVSSSGPRDQLRYLHNRGDGRFDDWTAAAGLTGITGGLNVIHADFNNDGFADLLVLRGGWWGKHGKYPPSLLKNIDGKRFEDVTEKAGMLSLHPTQTASWADYDNDGFVDLFLGHESSREEAHPSQLFHNNGDGTFTDIAPQAGLADLGYVKGVAWGDFNNDGRPDLYVSRKGELNKLFQNEGGGRFTDVTAKAGVGEPVHSFPTWWFDYDNDGWLDLLVAGYYTETIADIPAFHLGLPNKAETPRLYRNNRDGTFRDVTKAMGLDRVILTMGCGIGDLDNDGWLDIYFATGAPEYETLLPNRMFRNERGKRFQDVTLSGGFGNLQKGHAVSFADFDRDGDQDVFEVLGGAYPGDSYFSVLLENPARVERPDWVGLKLVGSKSNRAAIGARVRFELSDGRVVHRVVQPGTSFGDTPFEIHLGLGTAAAGVKSAEIRWPSGQMQSIVKPMNAGRVFVVKEGEDAEAATPVKRFAFANPNGEKHKNHVH
jgi:hypothetical protein